MNRHQACLLASLAVSILGAAPAVADPDCFNWTQLPPHVTCPWRGFHTMVYDSARGVIVLYGGTSGSYPYNNDTWEFDGTTWTQRFPLHSPRARTGHAMVYDSGRHVTVLFGGQDPDGNRLAETWEWDGTDWTLRTPATSPQARYKHAMAYDSARGVTVLFSGDISPGVRDTWEWNGINWTKRNPVTSPLPRVEHAMVYDAARGVTVLFGGNGVGLGYFWDTWEWNGTNWTQRNPAHSPDSRATYTMAYDSARHVAILFGGATYNGETYLGDTWEWNGTDWTDRTPPTGPDARGWHGLAYDAAHGATVLFGGVAYGYANGRYFGDTWKWNGTAWTPHELQLRAAGHAMAYDAARNSTLLFGGHDGWPLGETWQLAGETWTRLFVPGPTPRTNTAMAYDSARARIVLFGGDTSGPSPTNDTWEWDGSAWSLRATTGPSPRLGHAMCYDATRARTVLYGGTDRYTPTHDTWEWDGSTWSQVANTGPGDRYYHAMAYDAARARVVLFSGLGEELHNPDRMGETWEWDGAAWALRSSSGPTQRWMHAMAYDADNSRVILFGGVTYDGELLDSWVWNGSTWRQFGLHAPAARFQHAMVYDTTRGKTVLFGGGHTDRYDALNDTWEASGVLGPPIIVQPLTLQLSCSDRQAIITVGAVPDGNLPLHYEWARDGWLVVDGGNISGATTGTLTIQPMTPADSGNYAVFVSDDCGLVGSAGVFLPLCTDLVIKPGNCPSVLNRESHGVLPMALVVSDVFSADQVATSTLSLSRADAIGGAVAPYEGPPGPQTVITDVASPPVSLGCNCDGPAGGDTAADLLLYFDVDTLVPALGLDALDPGTTVELVLRGERNDGWHFAASNCVQIVSPAAAGQALHLDAGAGGWLDVSPLDLTQDGGGFGNFDRHYQPGELLTLTAAPRTVDGRIFTGWRINGEVQPVYAPVRQFVMPAADADIAATYEPRPFGDLNCDGAKDGRDIGPFIQALISPDDYMRGNSGCSILNADFNQDCQVNAVDVAQFTLSLLGQ